MKNKFNIAIVVFIISVLMVIELPYSDKTIPNILIPNIHFENSTLMLSGIIPIAGFIWSFNVFNKSQHIRMNGLLFFIIYVAVLIPATTSVLEYTKWPIYSFAQGCDSIEVKDSEISYMRSEIQSFISLNMEIKGYENIENGFKVDLAIEDENSEESISYKTLDEEFYISKGARQILTLNFPIEVNDDQSLDEFFDGLYRRDYVIRLYNEDSSHEYARNDEY